MEDNSLLIKGRREGERYNKIKYAQDLCNLKKKKKKQFEGDERDVERRYAFCLAHPKETLFLYGSHELAQITSSSKRIMEML
jgi:hypothetical protein